MPILTTPAGTIDYAETGAGPTVVLLHSSVSGNRQWKSLTALLQERHRVIAPNLIGYGQTSPWSSDRPQSLEDQARVVLAVLDARPGPFTLVGHSFGTAVAMWIALERPECVSRLVLIEPLLFHLLGHYGRDGAFQEALRLRDCVKQGGARGDWAGVAAVFADYWNGDGTWAAMPDERRATFAVAVRPNVHEWDAVLGDRRLIEGAAQVRADTTVLWARDTKRPVIEAVELLRDQAPGWRYHELAEGGHMAPLTRPDLVNPLVVDCLATSEAG